MTNKISNTKFKPFRCHAELISASSEYPYLPAGGLKLVQDDNLGLRLWILFERV